MNKLEDYLVGHWTNRYQAQSDPTNWASVEIVWTRFEQGFQSMNYKRTEGPDLPYRKKNHKIIQLSDTEAMVQNYHLDWTRHEECDIIFKYDGNAWHGKLAGDKCRGYRGNRVVSEIHVWKNKLHTMDQGYCLETGKLLWGSTELYRFTRRGE